MILLSLNVLLSSLPQSSRPIQSPLERSDLATVLLETILKSRRSMRMYSISLQNINCTKPKFHSSNPILHSCYTRASMEMKNILCFTTLVITKICNFIKNECQKNFLSWTVLLGSLGGCVAARIIKAKRGSFPVTFNEFSQLL